MACTKKSYTPRLALFNFFSFTDRYQLSQIIHALYLSTGISSKFQRNEHSCQWCVVAFMSPLLYTAALFTCSIGSKSLTPWANAKVMDANYLTNIIFSNNHLTRSSSKLYFDHSNILLEIVVSVESFRTHSVGMWCCKKLSTIQGKYRWWRRSLRGTSIDTLAVLKYIAGWRVKKIKMFVDSNPLAEGIRAIKRCIHLEWLEMSQNSPVLTSRNATNESLPLT